MNYTTHIYGAIDGNLLVDGSTYGSLRNLLDMIEDITDDELLRRFESNQKAKVDSGKIPDKSIQATLNRFIKELMSGHGWAAEPPLRNGDRLDFRDEDKSVAVEVAFNHYGIVEHNIHKLALSYAENATLGVLVAMTGGMKQAGGCDNTVGTYEHYRQRIEEMQATYDAISFPLVLVGIEAPETFHIAHYKNGSGRNMGYSVRHAVA